MKRETRGWSAVVRPGAVRKLVVRGEVSTHPYAQVFLKQGRSPKDEANTLSLTLCVLADTQRADLKDWTPVTFETSLLGHGYDRVTITGTCTPIHLDIRQPAGT